MGFVDKKKSKEWNWPYPFKSDQNDESETKENTKIHKEYKSLSLLPLYTYTHIFSHHLKNKEKTHHYLDKWCKIYLLDIQDGNRVITVWRCVVSCIFYQTQTLLQVNICSVSAWFLSNIDLLMRNTQQSQTVIMIQRGSRYILCDGLAVAVGGPWPGSLVGPAQQSGGTWCKYRARGALRRWCRVLLQHGCYQYRNRYRSSIPHCAGNDGGKVLLHNERRQWWRRCIGECWIGDE